MEKYPTKATKMPYNATCMTLFIVEFRKFVAKIRQRLAPSPQGAPRQPVQQQPTHIDALSQERIATARHAVCGPLIAETMLTVTFGTARDHDARGVMASQGKVDE